MTEQQPKPAHGSCLCGQVKVKVTGTPVWTNLCFCTDCRKSTGTPMQSSIAVTGDNYSITAPANLLSTFTGGTGSPKIKTFCSACGSTISMRSADASRGDFVIVPMGLLDREDGAEDPVPKLELFCKRRPAWLGKVEGSHGFEEIPPKDFFGKG